MAATKRDLLIDQGVPFALSLTWESPAGSPVDLTSYTAALDIRSAFGAVDTLLSLANGSGITLGGAAGTIAIALTASQTAALDLPTNVRMGTYAGEGAFRLGVYDLILTTGGEASRFMAGTVYLSPGVTL